MKASEQACNFAKLIRIGLQTKGVVEDRSIWGAGEIRGRIEANVVGLALIGKIGAGRAILLFEQALPEALTGDEDSQTVKIILGELGLDSFEITEDLVALNYSGTSAAVIADQLENGQIIF